MTTKHPDTGEDLTPVELERLRKDCAVRLQKAADDLNQLLRRSGQLGLEREVAVLQMDDTVATMDLSYNPDPAAWLPVVTTGPKYPFVHVGRPGLLRRGDSGKDEGGP